MASKNVIVLAAQPQGVFMEGIISGTPLPGTIMQIKAAEEPVGGRFTFEAFNRDADGNRPIGAHWVLDFDGLQGKTVDDAYADGDYARLYCPPPGEEINCRVSAAGTGTSDSLTIGQLLIVNDGDGLLIATTGSPECEPFTCMETVADVTSTGTLVHCMATGY